MLNTPLPYGLRDVQIQTMAPGTETPGTPIDFPNSRTFSFAEAEEFEELRGDDGLVAVHGRGPTVNWQLEGGGTPLEAIAAMFGGTIIEAGVTPNETKTYRKGGHDVRPYFLIRGQAISDSGGDFKVKLFKARATGDLSGELSDGSFWLTGAQGQALPNAAGDLYEFVQSETSTPLAPTDEVQIIHLLGAPTGGTFAITLDGQTTAGIAHNASAATVQAALEALSNVAPGDVVVTGASPDWTVTFAGAYAGENVPEMTVNPALLTGGAASADVETTQEGGQ